MSSGYDKLEPDAQHVDHEQQPIMSIAISLKRIADTMQRRYEPESDEVLRGRVVGEMCKCGLQPLSDDPVMLVTGSQLDGIAQWMGVQWRC